MGKIYFAFLPFSCLILNLALNLAADCEEASLQAPDFRPGVKTLKLSAAPEATTYTTMCSEDGWTLIQARGQFENPGDFFYRGWNEYVNGFGIPGRLNIN